MLLGSGASHCVCGVLSCTSFWICHFNTHAIGMGTLGHLAHRCTNISAMPIDSGTSVNNSWHHSGLGTDTTIPQAGATAGQGSFADIQWTAYCKGLGTWLRCYQKKAQCEPLSEGPSAASRSSACAGTPVCVTTALDFARNGTCSHTLTHRSTVQLQIHLFYTSCAR
jgi:hypothetical protein